jgi:hypothetical protein
MSQHARERQPLTPEVAVTIGALVAIGLLIAVGSLSTRSETLQLSVSTPTAVYLTPESALVALDPLPGTVSAALATDGPTATSTLPPSATPTPTITLTPSSTPTPTVTPTPTATPTPTLDLSSCNLSGCGSEAVPLPTLTYSNNLLLAYETPKRRICPECPENANLTESELDVLVGADDSVMTQLRDIAYSQEPYEVAPGIVYIVADYVHHVVIDVEESGFRLRNIIPPIPDVETRENVRITPSYCFSPDTLLVTTADYHGLVGSNRTETGREIFFHLGRAAVFKRNGEFDLDVIREHAEFAETSISWGGGPLFIWEGEYNFNPEQEWFTEESLDHYQDTTWTKLTAAVSEDRKYLIISASFGIKLKEHAERIIEFGEIWGIKVDRAMRFDGSESAYMAIRMGENMVPVLGLKEPLIVNCLAIEKEQEAGLELGSRLN